MSDMSEKRATSRFHAGLPAVLHLRDGDHPCSGEDLGREGVLLVGELPRAAGASVEVTLQSATGDLALRCKGKVSRVTGGGDEPTQLGIRFTELTHEAQELLELLIARVVEGLVPADLQGLAPNATVPEIRKALDAVPLAHRLSLAARATPRLRELLFHDTHPQVIDALARNPQLLPNEVRAMLRMPHLLPGTLETLARDGRWRGNEELKILIAGHRNTPFALGEQLASSLGPEALKKLIRAPGLNPALRANLLRRS